MHGERERGQTVSVHWTTMAARSSEVLGGAALFGLAILIAWTTVRPGWAAAESATTMTFVALFAVALGIVAQVRTSSKWRQRRAWFGIGYGVAAIALFSAAAQFRWLIP